LYHYQGTGFEGSGLLDETAVEVVSTTATDLASYAISALCIDFYYISFSPLYNHTPSYETRIDVSYMYINQIGIFLWIQFEKIMIHL